MYMKRGVLLIIGIVFLLIFGVIIFLFARGGNKTVVSPVVKVWAPFDEKKVYDELTKPFLEVNPGVSVDFKYIEASDAKDYEAKVVDAIASGTGPDVWLIRTDWLPKHAPKLTTLPAGLPWDLERDEEEAEGLVRIFSKAIIDQNSFQGAIYGFPLAVDSLALYVNDNAIERIQKELNDADNPAADVLDEYPKTWSDLEAWVRAITRKNKTAITQPAIALGTLSNTYAATDVYNAMLAQFGGNIYNTPTEVALHLALGDGSIPASQALALYTSFSTASHPNYTWNETMGDPVKKFVSGELPMLIGYSTLESQMLRLDSEISQVTIVPLPQRSKIVLPTDERTDFAAYWTHVVPKTSQNQQLAWDYVYSLIGGDNQRLYAEKTLKSPYFDVNQGEPAAIDETGMGESSVFPRQVLNAQAILKPEWQFVDQTIQSMIRSAQAGLLSVQAAVDTAAQQLKDAQ